MSFRKLLPATAWLEEGELGGERTADLEHDFAARCRAVSCVLSSSLSDGCRLRVTADDADLLPEVDKGREIFFGRR